MPLDKSQPRSCLPAFSAHTSPSHLMSWRSHTSAFLGPTFPRSLVLSSQLSSLVSSSRNGPTCGWVTECCSLLPSNAVPPSLWAPHAWNCRSVFPPITPLLSCGSFSPQCGHTVGSQPTAQNEQIGRKAHGFPALGCVSGSPADLQKGASCGVGGTLCGPQLAGQVE